MSTRIYRAAWLVVAVPVLVAAFSVGRPDALPAPRVQPFFDRGTAVQFASEFANQFPNNHLLTSILHALGMTSVTGVGDGRYAGNIDAALTT